MEIALILTVGAMCIISFTVGAKVGQKVVKGEDIQLPNINPVEAYRKHEERREANREKERIDTILANIDSYNGTPIGQKDVPR